MRTQGIVAAASMIALAFAGCLSPGSSLSIEAPVWHSGYSFAYRVIGQADMEGAFMGVRETHTEKIGPFYRLSEVLNTTMKDGSERVYLSGVTTKAKLNDSEPDDWSSASGPGSAGTEWMGDEVMAIEGTRARDLNDVPVSYSASASCTQGICQYDLGGLSVGPGPQWTLLDFPLTKGKTWEMVLDSEGPMLEESPFEDFGSELQFVLRARVVGPAKVNLPLGTVDAMRVDFDLVPVDLDEYLRIVREEAREEGASIERFDLAMNYRLRTYYSDEYQTFVRVVTTSDMRIHLKGEEDGEKFEFFFHHHLDLEQVLEGARLTIRPERDFDYMARVLANRIPLGDPTGSGVAPVSYQLRVVPSKALVNAAQPETVTAKVELIGVGALPEGHRVEYRLLDAASSVVHKGTGLSFEHLFDQPGRYSVEAEAFDARGRSVAFAQSVVVANYEKKTSVNCGPASLGNSLLPGCAAVPVPVRFGVVNLVVKGTTSGAVEAANSVRLRLTDAGGRTTNSNTGTGGTFTITKDSFGDASITDRDWTLRLEQARAVMQNVEYDVRLDYGSPTLGMSPASARGLFLGQTPQTFLAR